MDEKLMVRDKGGFVVAMQKRLGDFKNLQAHEIDELYQMPTYSSILVPRTQVWRTDKKGKLIKIYHLN